MAGKLIGLTGYAQSGKDEFAKSLALRGGFIRMGMSDALNEMALVLNPILLVDGSTIVTYEDMYYTFGYDRAKQEYPQFRAFLQRLGTEAVREILGENSWTQAAERRFVPLLQEGRNVAVTGIRFASEMNMIKRYGGTVIRIERPGFGPVNSHSSDALDEVHADMVVFNGGTLQDLANEAQATLVTLGM